MAVVACLQTRSVWGDKIAGCVCQNALVSRELRSLAAEDGLLGRAPDSRWWWGTTSSERARLSSLLVTHNKSITVGTEDDKRERVGRLEPGIGAIR